MAENVHANGLEDCLIHEAPQRNVVILWLTGNTTTPVQSQKHEGQGKKRGYTGNNVRNKLSKDANVLKTPLRICNPHDAIQEVNEAKATRVIVPGKGKKAHDLIRIPPPKVQIEKIRIVCEGNHEAITFVSSERGHSPILGTRHRVQIEVYA